MTGLNIIGAETSQGTGKTFQARSPLNSSLLPERFFEAGTNEVDLALSLAEKAFLTYRKSSGETRATFLETIAEEILAVGDALIQRANAETGLPEARLVGERARTVGQLRLFAEAARNDRWRDVTVDEAIPDRQPVPKPHLHRKMIPIGPVIVFGSSNFPLAFSVAGGDTASALATGNPVIVKAHSGHPGTAELVGSCIQRAAAKCGLPSGVFSMLHGSGRIIGTALARHPLSCAVGFTGSHAAGRALFDAAAARPSPIPVFAEMSSLNPVFILPEALKERATALAEGLKNSITLGVGQFCTKPGLIFALEGPDLDALRQSLIEKMGAAAPATMLHEGIRDSFEQNLAHVTGTPGVTVIASTTHPVKKECTHGTPTLAETSAAEFLANPAMAEEVFGPFALLVKATSNEQLLAVASSLAGQLTATLHGTPADFASAGELIEILERKAGRLIANGYPTGVEVCASMTHGGPYPATTDVRFTSVGTAALQRFIRPVTYQDFPQ
jgi:NADP-dependent aldehyde dehydrogenase